MDYIERQEGPNGQYCELLTRMPYQNQRTLEVSWSFARSAADRMDAALRALLVKVDVLDALTGERTDDIDKAATEVVQPWRERAMELYNAWYKVAFPGPKGTARTDSRTRTSGPKKPAPATGASS